MAFRGERFVVDLDDDTITIPSDPVPSPFSLIGEIREREPTAATPPAPAPPSSASSTGFPAHRRRNKTPSFKERRAEQKATASATPASLNTPPTIQDDKRAIGEENKRHLASMSEAQIQREREELMKSMDPGLLERFLRRARIDDDEKPSSETAEATSTSTPAPAPAPATAPTASNPKKSVSFDIPLPPAPSAPERKASSPKISTTLKSPANDDRPPTHLPKDLRPASEKPPIMDPSVIENFHFPRPTQPMPVLDPSSPDFLTDLQSHYFPEMTTDPAALSWLRPPSSDPEDPDSISPYHPASSASSMSPSEIRFSLRGTILGPSTSLALPTTLGLHHHGNDPQAAGYTIPELAILSRSTFAAQRCIAWQVLGRILFRLGKGEFGERGGQLSEGLWFVIEKEGVVGGMLAEAEGVSGQDRIRGKGESGKEGDEKDDTEEEKKAGEQDQDRPALPVASGIGRHASAAAWAMESVWLWQKGGGGDRGLLKPGQTRPR
ncbi:Transcription factor Rba50 [Penicillium subrubescens]|uniref:RNA polymerase II-associated protein RBA50 n=1 Tax=Penicillium subrubescens TaxID=1316194 RepID=A0A1Q5UGD1_9EURO|nr:Transcription factor Rba50 [Penicillium subrubescens]KAJ5886396.1 Transcription factor Rba50 [Penicillium subrubescens]OKP11548.1 RNA polymerase II-associated protein RBA50 [Penicillium subrubescens]